MRTKGIFQDMFSDLNVYFTNPDKVVLYFSGKGN